MLEWTYITNRIYQDNLFNDKSTVSFPNISFGDHTYHDCNVAHFQSIENNLALNYFETLNLSDEIKNDFLKQSLYRLVIL